MNDDTDLERTTLHISDDTGRIAMLELRNTDYDSDGCEDVLIRYVYSNHLQSASLELDEDGEIISYEEYHPYGTTSYQAKSSTINAVAKRYRYTGKERDEESGLYYHGARYYAAWLGRWTSVDPLESKYAGMSSYNYSFNNPVVWNDLNGADPDDYKGVVLPEVTITDKLPDRSEGTSREVNDVGSGGYGMDMPIETGTHTEYWHRGNNKYAAGWYTESQFVDINAGVMLGLIASQAPDVLHGNRTSGALWAVSYVANVALDFIEKNQGKISPNFLALMSKHGSELVKDFNEAHGDAIYPSAFDPIADLLPSIIKGLATGLIKAGTSMMEGLTQSINQFTIKNAQIIAYDPIKASLTALSRTETLESVEVGFKATAIGRMKDLEVFLNDPVVDTWAKSGLKNQRVTWAQNKAWLDERIARGDKFYLATDPATLPEVKGGYIEGTPNGYFTARELEYLNSKGIKPIAKYKWKD